MKREILFKAKDKLYGNWLTGDYAEAWNNSQLVQCIVGIPNIMSTECGDDFSVIDPDTLCQFTGLLDSEGTKIFENDILKSLIVPSARVLKVEYREAAFILTPEDYEVMTNSVLTKSTASNLLVVGNVHDYNP